jgi:hypothetical protein
MKFKILTTGNYEIVSCIKEARYRIEHYRLAGIFEGLKFVY